MSRRLDEDLTLTALRQALQTRQPQLFHSDQDAQYTAKRHVALLHQVKVTISMADVGEPTQNALAERFMRTLKEEQVAYAEYDDCDDAYRQLKHWLEVEYMHERIHSALAYQTPAEFEAACQPSLPRTA
jgi:putative transposase